MTALAIIPGALILGALIGAAAALASMCSGEDWQ